jgi:heme exporter protein D
MQSVLNFLAMGGYARFVWPAYAVTLVILGTLVLSSLRSYRTQQRELARKEREGKTRRRAR